MSFADVPSYPHPPYRVRRYPVYAPEGVVATSQPLAAQAGLAMLREGGTAVDAALAAAVALTVLEPASCSMGGDAFALVWDGARLHGLNGSGRAPAALSTEVLRARGHTAMPDHGWTTVTVPGAVAAWHDLHARFGRLPFARLFEPAIAYAERGFPVATIAAYGWQSAIRRHATHAGPEFAPLHEVFAPGGAAPRAGAIWRSPQLAHSLRRIAQTGGAALYRGEIAEALLTFSAQTGGFLSAQDLAEHASTWVEPIHTAYRDHEVWEIPPNGQGLTALLALNILEGVDLPRLPRESVERYHLQIEAMKLAYADAHRYIADADHMELPLDALLSKSYAAQRRALIGEEARTPEPGDPLRGNTAYLCAADSQGMLVSLIESTFSGFGSGIAVPGTGIALQNRGSGFVLTPGHPNLLAPRKRPYHTIIPGFLTRGGEPVGPFGVMGGHMQPQGHVQVVAQMVDYGLDPQASLDAPRWFWWTGRAIKLEPEVDPAIVAGLVARGHDVEIEADVAVFGRGQIIRRLPSGGYVAGSESRTDGCAAGY